MGSAPLRIRSRASALIELCVVAILAPDVLRLLKFFRMRSLPPKFFCMMYRTSFSGICLSRIRIFCGIQYPLSPILFLPVRENMSMFLHMCTCIAQFRRILHGAVYMYFSCCSCSKNNLCKFSLLQKSFELQMKYSLSPVFCRYQAGGW